MSPRENPVEEIEVTPEMIEAGAKAIFEYRDDLVAWSLAEVVYRAMERAKMNRPASSKIDKK